MLYHQYLPLVTPTLCMSFFTTSMNILCDPCLIFLPGSSAFSILCSNITTLSPLHMSKCSLPCLCNLTSSFLHWSNIILRPTAQYCVAKIALTLGLSTRPWPVCLSIRHWNVSNRSFKTCKMQGVSFVDLTCLPRKSHRCLIGLRFGKYVGQVSALNSLLCSSNHWWVPWWKRPQQTRNIVSIKGCALFVTTLR